MIELVALAIAAGAGAAVAGFRRFRRAKSAPVEVKRERQGPVDLGDVLVLDGGHGKELWLARSVALVEGDADPFLMLFECDGPSGARAVVAFDPAIAGEIAILTPHATSERVPQSLEIDGTIVSLERRRVATAKHEAAAEVEGPGDLATGEVVVATYRGGARYAVIVGRSVYGGRVESLAAVSVLAAS